MMRVRGEAVRQLSGTSPIERKLSDAAAFPLTNDANHLSLPELTLEQVPSFIKARSLHRYTLMDVVRAGTLNEGAIGVHIEKLNEQSGQGKWVTRETGLR